MMTITISSHEITIDDQTIIVPDGYTASWAEVNYMHESWGVVKRFHVRNPRGRGFAFNIHEEMITYNRGKAFAEEVRSCLNRLRFVGQIT